MSDHQDPSLADAVRSVRALGEDRYGIEPDGDEHGAHRVHPNAATDDDADANADEEDPDDAQGEARSDA